MNISKLVLSLCLAGILFTACGAPSPTGKWEGTVEEENGIRTVSNPETPFFGEIHLELENDLILGEGEDENSIFFQAAAMAVDETGTMFIVDSGNHRIQVFDPEGKFVQSIGKQGQGPGEFDRLGAFFLAGDGTLYARDNNRIQRFKNDGTLLSSIPLTNTIADFWVAPDRHIFGVEIRNSEEGRRRFLVKLDPEGKQLESMAEFSDVKPVDQESGGVRRRVVIQHSYNPTLFLASFSPETFIYAYSAEYALYRCNSSGKPDLILKKAGAAASISQREKDRVRQRLKDRVEELGMSIPDQILEQGTQFPPTSPFFVSVQIDELGRFYVRRIKSSLDDSPTQTLDIFGPEGHFLYQAVIDVSPSVITRGVLYELREDDEDGIIRLKRFKIKNWDSIKTGIE